MQNNPKILVVCDKDASTSFGRLSLDIYGTFKKMGMDASLLWLMTPDYFHGAEPTMGDVLKAPSFLRGFFCFRQKVNAFLQNAKPDLIFWVCPELGFLVPGIKKNFPQIKNVVMVHDAFPKILYPNSLKYKLIYRLFLKPAAAADYFVYNSRYSKASIEANYKVPNNEGPVIGCPVNFEVFRKPEAPVTREEKKSFWQGKGLQGYDSFCLNVSLDEPRKNIETFLQMAEKRPNTAFVRVGVLTPRLKQLIAVMKLKNVFHFTHLSAAEIRDFYWHVDLLVFPSFYEGFGLPPVEAIAAGTPAVCGGNTALKENLEGICPLAEPADKLDVYLMALDDVLAGKEVVDSVKAEKLFEYCSNQAFSNRLQALLKQLLF